jgi:hypothetical protein
MPNSWTTAWMVAGRIAVVRIISELCSQDFIPVDGGDLHAFYRRALVQLYCVSTSTKVYPITASVDRGIECGINAVMEDSHGANERPMRLRRLPSVYRVSTAAKVLTIWAKIDPGIVYYLASTMERKYAYQLRLLRTCAAAAYSDSTKELS